MIRIQCVIEALGDVSQGGSPLQHVARQDSISASSFICGHLLMIGTHSILLSKSIGYHHRRSSLIFGWASQHSPINTAVEHYKAHSRCRIQGHIKPRHLGLEPFVCRIHCEILKLGCWYLAKTSKIAAAVAFILNCLALASRQLSGCHWGSMRRWKIAERGDWYRCLPRRGGGPFDLIWLGAVEMGYEELESPWVRDALLWIFLRNYLAQAELGSSA